MSFRKIVFIAVWLLSGSVTFGQTAKKETLTLDGAERVIAAAKAKAQELKSPGGVIAVVDAGGNLMALARIDGTFAAGGNNLNCQTHPPPPLPKTTPKVVNNIN